MGQQQLLLIVLGVIIVGIAIVVGIQMFGSNASSSNTDAVISDLNNLAAKAQQYYVKPTAMGGGGNSFTGWTIPASDTVNNPNGSYTATVTASQVLFKGVGNRPGTKDPAQSVTVWDTVKASSVSAYVQY